MTRQIAKLNLVTERWEVIFDSGRRYPFSVYHSKDGHRKKLIEYTDLDSCFHFIARKVTGRDWRMI